ncbi:MAG: efflux RND transporter periplasmic adaptor subunit [bacterium]
MTPTIPLFFRRPDFHAWMRLALGAFILSGISACTRQQGGPPVFPPPAVRTALAEQMDAPIVITAFGTTGERASVDIIPQVSGTLIKSHVPDGAIVTNGQPLFEIDPRDYALRMRQVESQLAADKAGLALTRTTRNRSLELHDKKLLADEDFDALQTRAQTAEAQVQADEALLEQARLNLSRCSITAPLAGICSKRLLDDGNLAAAGMSRLINIRSYDPLTVEFSVSEQYLPAIRKAMQEPPVRIDVAPRGDTNRYAGTLEFMDNAVSSQTGTILLRGQVPNADLRLWARQFVEIRVFAGAVRNAVLIPEGAVQFGKMGQYLYTVSSSNTADLRIVKTGVRYDDRIQIVTGVAPQERVVVLGQLMLRPGAPVKDLSQMPNPGEQGK